MSAQREKHNELFLTKEVFIDHKQGQIEKYYDFNPQSLGSGGFGEVFQAKRKRKAPKSLKDDQIQTSNSSLSISEKEEDLQQMLPQSRAIKRLCFDEIKDKKKLQDQIDILSYLDHPSILKLYQTYKDKKYLYLVTDLLKGGDLFSLVNEQSEVDQQQIKYIFRQIIKALCYLHSQNICHRDLKLQNVMFLEQESDSIKLIDFGLSVCWEEDMREEIKNAGEDKMIAGTPDYMSPEMAKGSYDERCDIWAAGVILYMLLTKNPPFPGDSDKQIIAKIKKCEYSMEIPQMNDINDQAKDLIQKILVPEDQRLTLQQILAHPWLKNLLSEYDRHSECSNRSIVSTKKDDQDHFDQEKDIDLTKTTSQRKLHKKYSMGCLSKPLSSQGIQTNNDSDDFQIDQRPEQLTIQKMQHYCKLAKLQKLIAIHSVSKLGQSKAHKYGQQYLLIDKNNDGTISCQDLTEYLLQTEHFSDTSKIKQFFKGLTLSQRGYISYTQYLACALSYNSIFKVQNSMANGFNRQLDGRYIFDEESSDSSSLNSYKSKIDIFDDEILYDLFELLDEDKDGLITRKDFITLFENNGIAKQNESLISQITKQFDETISSSKISFGQSYEKYKQNLSRNYKGQKDGGWLDFEHFKSLIQNQQKLVKVTVL